MAIGTAALALPVAVANLILAFFLEPRLASFGLVVIVVVVAAMIALARYQVHRNRIVQRETRELFATSIQMVEAIAKLRVADADNAELRSGRATCAEQAWLLEHCHDRHLSLGSTSGCGATIATEHRASRTIAWLTAPKTSGRCA